MPVGGAEVMQALGDAGFQADSGGAAHRTLLLDLSPSLEELRKRFDPKWRNKLNQGEKRGLRVEQHHDAAAMERFEALYDAMWSKKRFETGVSVSSFRKLQELLPPGERLTILFAYIGDELAAGHVFSTLGETCIYLLGASNEIGRENKASHLLQWHAVEAAKSAGAKWYDLGGIDPETNPGVYQFKAGLGGVDTTFVGQFTARARGSARYLVPLAERVYRALSPLRRSVGR
jgi:lipid II:glycine glycyltransferase (peptidoglycan interpeptide bridge formation enzyme)